MKAKVKIILILVPLICFIIVGVALIIYSLGYTRGLEYALNEDGESYTVTGIGTAQTLTLKIPDTYKGKPVTAIGDTAFENCTIITTAKIPDSITTIGFRAFNECTNLTSVIFENTSGWEANGKSISSGMLSNEQYAADLLNYTYCGYVWTCSIN